MTNIQAIDLLKGLEQSLDDYCELNDEGKTAFRMAIIALEVFGLPEQLPPAQTDLSSYSDKLWRNAYERGKAEAQQWIPCSERLPEKMARVLTCSREGDIWINDYNPIAPTAWAIDSWAVIAWMPLPEPYKEV